MSNVISVLPRFPAPLRIFIFLLGLVTIWLPLAIPIYGLLGGNPNLVSIITMILLYAEFLILLQVWGRRVHRQSAILKHYGFAITRQNGLGLLLGMAIGIIGLFSLFLLQGLFGWVQWQGGSLIQQPLIALEGLAIAIGVGIAEELFFRGWLLDELERDYRPTLALFINSLVFALLHFIKPLAEILRTWPQFAGLVVLGILLVWAKRQGQKVRGKWARSIGGQLGLPIGLHAGLVWGYYLINVGQLITYTGRVPAWVTGIDKNPLAGLMGLLFLGLIGLVIKNLSTIVARTKSRISSR